MALHFVVDAPLGAAVGDTVEIGGAEAHHAAAVRRVRSGEVVTVGDGAGVWLTAEVVTAEPKRVVVRVTGRDEIAAPRRRVVLVQALAKGDRDELAVQAATELGVDAVVPWQASRSVSRWSGPKADKGVQRWSSIVREAAKQAHRAWIPTVDEPTGTSGLVALAAQLRMLVLEPTASARLSDLDIVADGEAAGDVALVVGPEGGIAPDELAALETAGATLVRLGDTVLRTSTAGPAALALVNLRLGRW